MGEEAAISVQRDFPRGSNSHPGEATAGALEHVLAQALHHETAISTLEQVQ